jgi:hypothetical protein
MKDESVIAKLEVDRRNSPYFNLHPSSFIL